MKFIHCADIHLSSKMTAKLPKNLSAERKRELLSTFERMVSYAKDNNVRAILMSGDVFDSDRPTQKDKQLFYSIIKNNPEIDFFYLKGNHDIRESYSENIDNLKTFSEIWSHYSYDNIIVSGCETENIVDMETVYSTLFLDSKKRNIVMLHGDINSEQHGLNLLKLQNKYIDYLALGHIHKHQYGSIDSRGQYVYPGCLEPRGFDETGEKGFVLLDINEFKVSWEFIPFSKRIITERNIDISGSNDQYEALRLVKSSLSADKENLIRINLLGNITFKNDGMEEYIEDALENSFYFVSVKDKTLPLNLNEISENDKSIKSEFVALLNKSEKYSEDEKKRIMALGLQLLNGGEIE